MITRFWRNATKRYYCDITMNLLAESRIVRKCGTKVVGKAVLSSQKKWLGSPQINADGRRFREKNNKEELFLGRRFVLRKHGQLSNFLEATSGPLGLLGLPTRRTRYSEFCPGRHNAHANFRFSRDPPITFPKNERFAA